MLNETAAQLVAHLSHPNGWWRDTAQQLLVLKQDRSVVPALQQLVRTSPNLLARIHALWTLEGLGALDPGLVREQLKDVNPQMRIQAMRVSESLYKAGDRSIALDVRALVKDADTDVVIQAMLTLNVLKVPDIKDVASAAQAHNSARGVREVATRIITPPALGRGGRGGGPSFSPDELATLQRGDAIYKELCFSCHGEDGRGTPQPGAPLGTLMAPSLVSSARVAGHREYVIKALLHGLQGPIDGQTYAGVVMAPMGTNRDEWIASVASYIRNSFGNSAPFVRPADVARVRLAHADRKDLWTFDGLLASMPRPLQVQPTWKATASHNPQRAAGAFNFAAWTTGAPQEAGMWFQVELPDAVSLTELQFNSAGGGFGGGRGRAGRGAAPPPGSLGQPVPAPTPGEAPAQISPVPSMPTGTFPRGYKVDVSTDGTTWTTVAEGQGSGTQTAIAFEPVMARFIRLTQTATVENAPPWSMQRLILYGPGQGR
jgi:mono/diheme cytochrome c family protein